MEENVFENLRFALASNNVVAVKMILEKFVYSFYKTTLDIYRFGIVQKDFVDKLQTVLQALDFVYISGEVSPLSDSEYDELHSIYNDVSKDIITNKFEPAGKKAKHLYPQLKGTLEKVHYVRESDKPTTAIKTHKSVESWLKSALGKFGDLSRFVDGIDISVYLKYDGISVVFAFEHGKLVSAITRGDKDTGEGRDVTQNFLSIDFSSLLPNALHPYSRIGVKTEVCMDKKAFEKYSKRYKTENRKLNDPRSAASGLVNADLLDKKLLQEYLTIVPLEYATQEHIEFPYNADRTVHIPMEKISLDYLLEQVENLMKLSKSDLDDCPINCDGLVIRFMDELSQSILGRDESNCVNKFEVAYKFPPEEKETTLVNVEFQVGLLGNITPVAKIRPVKLKNRTIKSISLGSIDRMESLNLHIGDTVLVKYEIIPYMTKIRETEGNTNPVITHPDVCPYCHTTLIENPVLMCGNENCPSRIMGKIDNFCDKMNIKGLGSSIIEAFFNAGILRSIQDLYSLEDHEGTIVELEGFGPAKFKQIIKAINAVNSVTMSTLLGSIGIKSIGRSKFEKILSIYYIDDLLEMVANSKTDIAKLSEVPGIGEATAAKVLQGIHDNRELIDFLLGKLDIVEKKGGDMNIVFSGIRNRELSQHLENLGFEIKDSVNKKTKAVITKDADTVTTKTQKATELGIPVIDLVTAYKVFRFVK